MGHERTVQLHAWTRHGTYSSPHYADLVVKELKRTGKSVRTRTEGTETVVEVE